MTYLPFLLLTPLVWLIVTVSFLNGGSDLLPSVFIGAYFVVYSWGLLLFING